MIRIVTTRRLRLAESEIKDQGALYNHVIEKNRVLQEALLKIRDLHTGRTDLIDDTTHDCIPSAIPCVTVQIVDQTLTDLGASRTFGPDWEWQWSR